jgi:hypothetical protein
VERALDRWTNLGPMHVELNRGAGSPWTQGERNILRWAEEYGYVDVQIDIRDTAPLAYLTDQTPTVSRASCSGRTFP